MKKRQARKCAFWSNTQKFPTRYEN